MVIRSINTKPFHLKINDKWYFIDERMLKRHPGGIAITAYRNEDATTAFHTFHMGSTYAYKMLQELPHDDDYCIQKEDEVGVSKNLQYNYASVLLLQLF